MAHQQMNLIARCLHPCTFTNTAHTFVMEEFWKFSKTSQNLLKKMSLEVVQRFTENLR